MKDQQNQQNPQIENPYEALDKLGRELVDLKLSGLNYQQLVEYLGKLGEKRQNQTVRDWFSANGKYFAAYQFMKDRKREQVEPEFAAINDEIKEGAVEAISVVRKEVQKGSLKAAMYLLKIAGFEVEQVRNISGNGEGVALLRAIIEENETRSSTNHQIV